jgi:hypothetical protein
VQLFNRVAAPELSSLWVIGHFGDGTQIPWDRNSKHFAFSRIAKVYGCVCMYVCMCMCMCVYKSGIKSDHVSLVGPVSALIV